MGSLNPLATIVCDNELNHLLTMRSSMSPAPLPVPGANSALPPNSHEEALQDYAARLANHKEGRRALHVCLSRLSPGNRLEHHIRIVMNTFEPLLRKFNGQLFRLWNNDIIVGTKGAQVPDIDDYVIKLRFLFSEDSLLMLEEHSEQQFCHWYDMEADHPAFMTLVQNFSADAAKHRQKIMSAASEAQSKAKQQQAATPGILSPLTPMLLDRFETALRGTDLSPMIERQMICSIPDQGKPKPVLCEHFVSIRSLQHKILPGVDCLSDRWLFQRLCQNLDARMLASLPEISQKVTVPITININISTILSAEFLKFDAAIRRITQQTMILEVQSIDLFADMGAYIFARDFAHERGYGIALDGLNPLTFPFMDRAKLKLDFEKIIWSPEIARDFNPERRETFIQAIKQANPSRIILCRCDNRDAIDFGREVGISLFQGRHVDRMLASS